MKPVITKYSQFFTVENLNPRFIKLVYRLSADYTKLEMKNNNPRQPAVITSSTTFGLYIDKGKEFRFVKGQLKDLMSYLPRFGIFPGDYEIVEAKAPAGVNVEIQVKEKWVLRADQPAAADFCLEDGEDGSSSASLLSMKPGRGKTVTSLVAAARRGQRIAIVVLARYYDKWVADVKKTYDIEDKDILEAKTGAIIKAASHYKKSGLTPPKVTIISLTSITGWFDLYEQDRNNPLLEAYGCKPHEFLENLGVGTVIMDEVHQHPYSVYRFVAYADVQKIIALSATMLDPDKILQRAQHALFPRSARYEGLRPANYVRVVACPYYLTGRALQKVRTTERGNTMYSQSAFEESIYKDKRLLTMYLERILDVVDESMVRMGKKGDKLAIYVHREVMGEAVAKAIQKKFPQYDTRTYLQKDPYENLLEPDIRVTTIGSGGTGADIPDLRFVFLTNSINSKNANVQVLGRLRELHDRDVWFYYLYSPSIPKQKEYHFNRRELFKDEAYSQGVLILKPIHLP